jgi:hypothetical protein
MGEIRNMSQGWSIRKDLSWLLQALIALWLSVIFVLYTAPTAAKYHAADLLAGVLLVLSLVAIGVRRLGLADATKSVLPLIAMLAYVIAQALVLGDGGGWSYIQQLLYGFVPYLLFYFLFRNQSVTVRYSPLIIMAIFILPGLVHVAYMYFDIGLALQKGAVAFSSKQGLLEYVKESPRVGRRYLSVAMLHLLCGGLLMAWYFRLRLGRYCAWVIVGLSVLSLALLDARAAYVSVIIGGLLMVFAVGPTRAWQALRSFLPIGLGWKLVLAGLLVGAIAVGYSAGKSRWVAMSYSFQAAVHDVFDAKEELAQRPYVNAGYWSAPIEDINVCYLEGHFRCKVDQSAYLRMAWLLVGLASVVDHPLGIGYSDNYLGRLWGVAGDEGKYQRSDSFLVEHIVSFGLPGVALYGLLFWGVLRTLQRSVRSGEAGAALVLVCGIILVCVGRGLVDVFSEGLWRYLMALLGMYYGLLHSDDWRKRSLSI